MTVAHVTTAAMGQDARAALEAAIERLKDGDRLKPVTVVPPNTLSGLSLRRTFGMRPGGLVNVRFLVLPRLIEFIGAPRLAAQGHRPLSDSFRIEAIRAVVSNTRQEFLGDVPLEGPALRSLDAAFSDFDQCNDDALNQIAANSPQQRYLVNRYREFRERVRNFYDDRELAQAAAAALNHDAPSLRDLGDAVLYLPPDLTPQQRSFLEQLASRVQLEVILGLSGDPVVDEHALAQWSAPPASAAVDAPPIAERILQAPDAEEEVRDTIRQLGERARNGQSLHRAAILYAQRDPYQRIAAEQLDAAGIPWNGRLPVSYGQTIVGRTLLSLLQLAERAARTPPRISWSEIVAPWLAGAPILDTYAQPVPAARWNQIARKANLLRDPQQWLERLDQYGAKLTEERDRLLADADDEQPWRARGIERDLRELRGFQAFVATLVEEIQSAPISASWSAYTDRAQKLLERYLGSRTAFANRLGNHPLSPRREEPSPSQLPLSPHRGEMSRSDRGGENDPVSSDVERNQTTDSERELEAWDTIHDLLRSLPQLDELGETDPARFLAAVERGLTRPAGRVGRFGQGVFVGSLSEAAGTDWEIVYILGAAERSLPPAQREDPLLPEALRGQVGLNGADDRARRQRSEYLAALWSAQERQLSYPRADVRGQRARLPSRWLLESASARRGERVYGSKIDTLERSDWFHAAPSFEWSIRNASQPGAIQEYDLRSLRQAATPQTHFLALNEPALQCGFELQQARRRPSFGEWDGRITDNTAKYAERPHSPTALQDWAVCPYRYFLGRVLRVAERDQAEDELTISPLEKGALIHDILDTFFRAVDPLASPGEQWSDQHRDQLAEIADAKMNAAEGRGVTGRDLLWTRERELIQNDLQALLTRDDKRRKERNVVQTESEFAFGLGADPPVPITLPDGRTVRLRGKIDRIDRSEDGSRLDVIDYKTGRALPAKNHLEADPVVAGQYLQLPIYAVAASARHPDSAAAQVSTAYWFITERGGFALREVDWGAEASDRFHDVLSRIIDGIGQGLFPAHPGRDSSRGPEHCQYCPYDAVCSRDRQRAWDATKRDRQLIRYVELVEGEPS